MTKENLDNWDDFCGSNFLKTINVANEQDAFVCIGVEIFEDKESNSKPRLTLEKQEKEYIFDLNVTNANFCKNNKIFSPRTLIGKKIYFKKVLVNSPKSGKEVESLRICKVE